MLFYWGSIAMPGRTSLALRTSLLGRKGACACVERPQRPSKASPASGAWNYWFRPFRRFWGILAQSGAMSGSGLHLHARLGASIRTIAIRPSNLSFLRGSSGVRCLRFSSFALASMPSFSLFPRCSCRCAAVAEGQTSRACARVGCLPILPIPRACARRGLFVFSVFARVADFSDNSLRLRAWRAPFL